MYQVLYRKYRPKVFADVYGQEHVTSTLKNEIKEGRIAHAYLFTGSRGTGKTTCAKILAKAVNCENSVDGEPCNECEVCKGLDNGTIYDVVEIDAGDTYAYDEEGKKTQAQREQKAAERLYGLLPEDQGAKLKAIWEEFEAKNTPESRFAHTMDNLQPVILNAATDGKAWKEHQVRLSQFMGRQEDTPKGSETLWRYEWEKLVKPFLENGTIRGDE